MSFQQPPKNSGLTAGAENFADEPEDFGQLHKVYTQNLKWLEADVRALKRHTWRVPATFGLCTLALTIAVSGGLEIVNYSGAARDAPKLNWILLVAGGAIAAVCFFFGCLALLDRNADVDKVANRVGEVKY